MIAISLISPMMKKSERLPYSHAKLSITACVNNSLSLSKRLPDTQAYHLKPMRPPELK